MSMSFKTDVSLPAAPKNKREPNWDDNISWFQMPDDDEVHLYRLVGAPFLYAQHWIQTVKRDGKAGKSYPVICNNYDSKTNTWAENGCEVCEWMKQVYAALDEVNGKRDKEKKIEWQSLPAFVKKSTRKLTMASNVIIRELQIQGPPANNSDGWSFIRQIRFPQGFSKTLKEKQDKFNKRDGKIYALNNIAEGRDLQISYNSNAEDIKNMYVLELGERTPITEEEWAHEGFLVDFPALMIYPDQAQVADSLRRNKYYDWLNDFKNSQPAQSIQKSAPPVQQPASPQPQGRQTGGFAATGMPEAPFESEEEPAGARTQAPAQPAQPPPIQAAAPAAPAQPAAPPVQAAPPPAAPKAAAPAPGPAPAANGTVPGKAAPIESRLQEFSGKFGAALVATNKTYEGKTLRLYRPDLAVPDCWSTYTKKVTENKDQCRGCPLRLDCMMVTA
jgi:hypothetical protein